MVRYPRWKIVLIAAIVILGTALAAVNLISTERLQTLPAWIGDRQVNLGLDLRGGSHILLQVDTAALIRERMDSVVDAARDALRGARIPYEGLGAGAAEAAVTIRDGARVEEARRLIAESDRDLLVNVGDGGRITLRLSEEGMRQRQAAAVEQSIEIIRRRIDATGVREPSIQRQGSDRVLVQLPGVDDPERIKTLIGKTAKMTFHLVDDQGASGGQASVGTTLLPMREARGSDGQRRIAVRKRVVVSGENLVDAQPTFQQGEPVVSFRFDTAGGKRFGDVTTQSVGKLLAIVLDGEVISAPRIREPILGGSGIITGSFSVAEARDLALLLRAGALPAPLSILEERTVGPALGADSIAAGKVASVVGLILVAVFMIAAYGLFGLFAVAALIMNMVLIIAALSLLQATLTLPGIAGIVLTIGMAVDANVLIFEHIREESALGKPIISSIEAGFERAFTTIVDSNLTTLFAGLLLYFLGSGPVRGFGVTLSIGIVTSMFTALTVTHLLVATWLNRTRPTLLPI
ncbi:MAG: protein translocase subunit SecD [Defluviicoccus sp.]|nr:protein translocase subunit SecD [Defluviicoccus sp.]MDG4591432.1 protein translocase subunit SecD [Defluviicoccus sp.]MDS4010943.1 protein translocase subunit SecD [Defluviicoccus sp.]MDS4072935.1 protein translocase subunit SecD [Defluviicoccus sp.]